MVEESILRRLSYAKSLYNVATNQFRQHSDIEISRSLVTLDNSVEAYMWVLLETRIPEKVNSLHGKSFREVTKEVNAILSNFELSSINELHDIRNNIQHKGILIAESQAQRYFGVAERVFTSSCNSMFGIDWNFVSLSVLIKEKTVADYILNAENFYAKGDFRACAPYMIMAFEVSKGMRQISQFGSLITMDRSNANSVIIQYPAFKSLFDYIDKIDQELEILKMGVEYNQWKGYRQELNDLNPRNSLFSTGQILDINRFPLFNESDKDIESWVRLNFPFIVETILKWEDSFERTGKLFRDISKSLDSFIKLFDSDNKN